MSKKVFIFAGRVHHYLRLLNIQRALSKADYDARWVCADNVWNVDPSPAYLIPRGEQFVHLLDYLTNIHKVTDNTRQTLSMIYKKRPKFADYIDPHVIAFSVRELNECLIGFRQFIEKEQPHCIILLHENNYWGKILAYVCQESGTPCIVFQEGLLRHRDQQTMNKQASALEYSNLLCVWSESARNAYIEAGLDKTQIKIVGIPHLDEWAEFISDERSRGNIRTSLRVSRGYSIDRPIVCFAPPVLNRYEGDINKAFSEISSHCTSTGIKLIVRLHPFESKDTRLSLEKSLGPAGISISHELDPLPTIALSDLVLTQHSTIGPEAVALGIRLAEIDLDNFGVTESLVEQGISVRIGDGELDRIGKILAGTVPVEADVLNKWKAENLGPTDGKASSRIVDIIRKIA